MLGKTIAPGPMLVQQALSNRPYPAGLVQPRRVPHAGGMDIIASTDPDDRGRRALLDLIETYNDAQTGLPDPGQKLALLIHDPVTGEVRGGLRAISYYGWMFIELLVLDESLRGQGLGTRLMREAEAEARRRGLIGIWLDTFSFQARPFYERLGYRVFGQLDDFPPGGGRFWLSKKLDAGPALAEKAPS